MLNRQHTILSRQTGKQIAVYARRIAVSMREENNRACSAEIDDGDFGAEV
jgi:hypothetical protein